MKQFCVQLLSAAALLAAPACSGVGFPDASEDIAVAAPDIDLEHYELTFDEGFRKVDVSAYRCDTRWIAHTPWHGDFGSAKFADPSRGFPFKTRNGLLRIEARKDPSEGWMSGLLSLRNTCGEGFAQQYGYFEARAMLPEGDGLWPAFWLIGVNTERYTAEIDVIEHHGHMPAKFSTTIHVHPVAKDVKRIQLSQTLSVPQGSLSARFNTFGVSVDENEMIFYFNRKEYWRTPTTEEFRQPLYPLVNLAMDAGYTTEDTPESAFMYVDYVRIYKQK